MMANHISFAYYGDQWNNYLKDKYQENFGAIGADSDEYCNICNPFQQDTWIMANWYPLRDHIKDTADLYAAIKAGTRRPSPSSSPAAWSMVTRLPRSWICLKASLRR